MRITQTFVLAGSATLLLSLAMVGCKSQPSSSNAQASLSPNRMSAAHPQPGRSPAGSEAEQIATPPTPSQHASVLASKTSQYARDLGPLLARHAARSGATRPSVVQWIDPTRDSLSKLADQKLARAAAPPAADSVNAPATLAAFQQDATVPQILPPSADDLSTPSQPATRPAPTALPTDAYEAKLRQLVVDYPHDLGNQLDYQLLRFSRDEPTPDLATVTKLSEEDSRILTALMDALNNLRNATRGDGNVMFERKIAPLLELSDRLRSRAELAIPTVALCTSVKSFGVYDELPSQRFVAGSPTNDALVYCEVANFTSTLNDKKMWETRLRQEMVLYTETGLEVWPENSNATLFVDQARNRRHDFFLARRIHLPPALTIGRYVLKVRLTDEQSNRVAEASLPIEMVAE